MSKQEALKIIFRPVWDWLVKRGISGVWIFVLLAGLVIYFIIIRPRFKYEYMKKVKLNYADIAIILCGIGLLIGAICNQIQMILAALPR